MPTKRQAIQKNYGYPNPQASQFPAPFIMQRDPLPNDGGEMGQGWVNVSGQTFWNLVGRDGADYVWLEAAAGSADFSSVTINPGDLTIVAGDEIIQAGNLTLDAGNIVVTAGDITVSAGEVSAVNFIAANSFETTNGNVTVNNTDVGVDAGLVALQKSRAGAIVVTGDELGGVEFWGFDGASQELSARIQVTSTGTIAANRVPSKMDFYTHADAAGDPILAMSIDDNQDVTFSQDVLVPGNAVRAGAAVITNGGIVDADTTATAAGPTLHMTKARGDAFEPVQVGDKLSDMVFFGADGTAEVAASGITAFVTAGTIALDRVPSNLVFFTHPDAATPAVDRMTIASTGVVTIATPDGAPGTDGLVVAAPISISGGAATDGLVLPNGPELISHTTSPNGVITSPKGSLCLVNDGSGVNDRLFVNTDGATAWTGIVTVS